MRPRGTSAGVQQLFAAAAGNLVNTRMNAQAMAGPAGLDDRVGVERASRWPWAVPRIGSLSGEGSDPPTVQGPGLLTSASCNLADVDAHTGGRRHARPLSRLTSARTVIAGERWP